MNAASECFSNKGFHNTTMQDIIQQSNLSPGAIYRYFKSKDELIQAIALKRQAAERDILQQPLNSTDVMDILEKLSTHFFGSLETEETMKDRRVGVQMWAEAIVNPEILQITNRGIEVPLAELKKLFARAQEQGRIDEEMDSESLARVIIALFQGFILQKVWDPHVPSDSYVKTVKVLLRNLAP
ncbi:TetR/AcrR family transcriptional regulator [Alicyclobacillus fastidiosus]|uniref:TetR/AcrR family transcriptional regulator n=1 Tax=Alicyclobacillus fastidiosus TaxID=392011 RepID=A0ABY6ZJC8_9BACL|nr:TetR/AcrR family transcriptional regulator [Alicyclobacillus fastidiosus]WAH42693.1 TetR/AcrR family transcriptional regulator [Alicyclobacillus fastidiosus]GMA64580.1 TetR family transcriptional regulator [Alicyclobacillus fastidiosus]